MATNTYVALETQTLSSAAASVTFSSIPSGYTDLRLVMQARTDTGNNVDYAVVKLNNDATSLYSRTEISGDGSSAGSFRAANFLIGIASTAQGGNTQIKTMSTIDFMNYSNSTTYKTCLYEVRDAGNIVVNGVGLYRSTSAISTITLTPYYGTWQSGSTFTLYGIAAASVGAKATGGDIYSDSSYYYHVFDSNGTFTPTQSISADVLVIAGGGAGNDGGGGAGGVAYYSGQSLTATGYTCTVGAGGSGSANGVNSTFGALAAAVGGGKGGEYNAIAAGNGGSGGGAARISGSFGTGTSGQGNNGGSASVGSGNAAGGGGGAGAAGGNNSGATGGAGGIGITTYNSWSQATGIGELSSGVYYLAGGGGGFGGTTAGAAGLGGGGQGSNNSPTPGTNGLANTGGGGGGRAGSVGWGAGGSGVIIVRYAK